MQVTVKDPDPDNDPPPFELLDDGLHGDGAADDGIYANTFSATELEGNYYCNYSASGVTKPGRNGVPAKASCKAARALAPFLRAVER